MGRVLLIEDDAFISQAVRIRLSTAGHEVHECADGDRAHDELVRLRPDLVILDVSLPGTSGVDVARRLRETPELAATPIVFLTASRLPALRDCARRVGAAAFLEKPFEGCELVAAVERALAAPRGVARHGHAG